MVDLQFVHSAFCVAFLCDEQLVFLGGEPVPVGHLEQIFKLKQLLKRYESWGPTSFPSSSTSR